MFVEMAPTLLGSLSPEEVERLEAVRAFLASTSISPRLGLLTDHTVAHSDAVLRILDRLVHEQHTDLNEIEACALAATCYLHDIGLRYTTAAQLVGDLRDSISGEVAQIYRETTEPDHGRVSASWLAELVRHEHAELAARVIREGGLPISLGPEGHTRLVATLCGAHSKPSALRNVPISQTIEQRTVRPRFLGALFILADALDVGPRRVIDDNLPRVAATLDSRLFWYRHRCVQQLEIQGPRVQLTFGRPAEFPPSYFHDAVVHPLVDFFSRLFSELLPDLRQGGFKELQLELRELPASTPDAPFGVIVSRLAAIEKGIRDRTRRRKDGISTKLRRKGLIADHRLDNELVGFRRWSSYTPRMPQWDSKVPSRIPGPEESMGGGYFLVWNKLGVAIDPGYDFLKNFWTEKVVGNRAFELDDIRSVVISHAHDDHSHDIEPIVSLLYQRAEAKKAGKPVPIFCSEGTRIKYERLFGISEAVEVWDLVPVDGISGLPSHEKVLKRAGIKLEYIRTIHNELPWIRNHTGVAMRFLLQGDSGDMSLGYTSDTRFFEGLIPFFKEVDVLIMHFGNLGPSADEEDRYDKNHLGLNGCHDLLSGLKDSKVKLFLLDEFGEEEIGDDRIDLCDLLTQSSGLADCGKTLLPLDVGLRIQLPQLRVRCQETNHNHFVDYGDIVAHLARNGHGIAYSCRSVKD